MQFLGISGCGLLLVVGGPGAGRWVVVRVCSWCEVCAFLCCGVSCGVFDPLCGAFSMCLCVGGVCVCPRCVSGFLCL